MSENANPGQVIPAEMNWKAARASVLDALRRGSEGLLEGAADDIETVLSEIASDRIRAAAGDLSPNTFQHLTVQVDLLLMIHQVRAAKAANVILARVASAAQSVVVGWLRSRVQ